MAFGHQQYCRRIVFQPNIGRSLHQHLILRFVAALATIELPSYKQALLLLLHDHACPCFSDACIRNCDDHNLAAGVSTFLYIAQW